MQVHPSRYEYENNQLAMSVIRNKTSTGSQIKRRELAKNTACMRDEHKSKQVLSDTDHNRTNLLEVEKRM